MRYEDIGAQVHLVELGNLSLINLHELEDSALAHALRRVLADVDKPGSALAAFQSYLDRDV
jgi:FXSXX-COOH protein